MKIIISIIAGLALALVFSACGLNLANETQASVTPGPWTSSVQVATVEPASTSSSVEAQGTATASVENLSTLTALPQGPNKKRTKLILEAFFDAYHHHDVARVVGLFSAEFQYGDCDYPRRADVVFQDEQDLAQWLRSRFTLNDHFEIVEMVVAPKEGSPPNWPRLASVEVIRTNDVLPANGTRSVFKIVMDESGDQIWVLNAEANIACRRGDVFE